MISKQLATSGSQRASQPSLVFLFLLPGSWRVSSTWMQSISSVLGVARPGETLAGEGWSAFSFYLLYRSGLVDKKGLCAHKFEKGNLLLELFYNS